MKGSTITFWMVILVIWGFVFYAGNSQPAVIEYKRRVESFAVIDTALFEEISKKHKLTNEQKQQFYRAIH
jgi:hypothetical protein